MRCRLAFHFVINTLYKHLKVLPFSLASSRFARFKLRSLDAVYYRIRMINRRRTIKRRDSKKNLKCCHVRGKVHTYIAVDGITLLLISSRGTGMRDRERGIALSNLTGDGHDDVGHNGRGVDHCNNNRSDIDWLALARWQCGVAGTWW